MISNEQVFDKSGALVNFLNQIFHLPTPPISPI